MALRSPAAAVAVALALLCGAGLSTAARPKVIPPPKLFGLVGAHGGLTLKTARGRTVVSLRPGWYSVSVVDHVANENFHLFGKGLDRRTGVRFVGAALWGVQLRKGVYVYRSDRRKNLARRIRVS